MSCGDGEGRKRVDGGDGGIPEVEYITDSSMSLSTDLEFLPIHLSNLDFERKKKIDRSGSHLIGSQY
jgi:hypothetical protein